MPVQNGVPGSTPVGIVRCPGCAEPMVIKSRAPIPGTDGLVDVVYRCEICGTETKRAVKDES